MAGLQQQLLLFGRLLRRVGLDVHTGRLLDASEALTHIDVGVREQLFHTCRTLLVHRHEDLALFDRAFESFWAGRNHVPGGSERQDPPGGSERQDPPGGSERQDPPYEFDSVGRVLPFGPADTQDPDPGPVEESSDVVRAWSDAATLADKDFAEFTSAELQVARAALARLTWTPGWRRTRRWVRGRGRRVDLRRALGRSLRTGGEVVLLPTRARTLVQRPLVLLCDVSGSMERYSRMLLHFAHVLGERQQRLEVFMFSTQLTRITREIHLKGVDQAVAAAATRVPDWSGGTRIGDALREFHQRWGRRVLHRGPVVLLISDGWDRGDPAALGIEVARLQRSCHRLIWLNPLAGTLDYEPLTRGLVAALPFVDDFLPARTLTDLADLAARLNTIAG